MSENGGNGGIDLENLDQKDPEMSSAVGKMLEQEEKDKGELEGEEKLIPNKQIVYKYLKTIVYKYLTFLAVVSFYSGVISGNAVSPPLTGI